MCGMIILGILSSVLFFSTIASLASMADTAPVMPKEAVLKIDMSTIVLAEQTREADPMAYLQSKQAVAAPLGIWNAISAINTAATDPAIKFIYLLTDGANGGMAQLI